MTVNSMTWEAAVQQLRARPDQRALVEACFYDDPLRQAADRFHASSEWAATQQLLGNVYGQALDIGAGRGIASYALARDGWSVTALEPDPSSVVGAGAIRSLASECHLDISVAQTWGEALPFDDSRFALVYCRQVLHHARDLQQLCREASRVLRPGGLLLATREHVISRREDLQTFLDGHPLHRLYGGENAFLLQDYIGAIQAAGLQIEQVLNPYASDINTYPESRTGIKKRWARKLRFPMPALIPDFALSWVGSRSRVPGRLFTFAARKPERSRE